MNYFVRRRTQLVLKLVLVVFMLVACTQPAETSLGKRFELDVRDAQINPAEAIDLQGPPAIIKDKDARFGYGVKFRRTNDEIVWNLQGIQAGTYKVQVSARAELYQGPPELILSIGDKIVTKAFEKETYEKITYGIFEVGENQEIGLRFENDLWEGTDDTDRNIIVDHLIFEPVAEPEPTPDPEDPEPKDPEPDDPGAGPAPNPNDASPTLIKKYYTLMARENDGKTELYPFYRNITYKPLNENAWDRLELQPFFVRSSQEKDPANWNRQEWLHLEFNRDATLRVVWNGEEIPSWLSQWKEIDTVEEKRRTFEKTFKRDQIAKLGRGEAKGSYNLLIGEGDGSNPLIPDLPTGISERPVPNQTCPAWVHDQYVAGHPDDGRMYRTWHPSIDPVYWCYFGHEHGSDPSLVNYTPHFGYTAAKNNNQDERHEGFKGFAFKNNDINWYLNVHATTGLASRLCVRFHTAVLAATDSDGKLLAELSFKADFGEARATEGDRPVIKSADCPQEDLAAADTGAEKRLRVIDEFGNEGYEQWSFIGQDFLGLVLERGRIKIDIRNPVTGCNNLRCDEFVVASAKRGDLRTLKVSGNLEVDYREESDMSDGKKDGYFYTDPQGTEFLKANDKNAVRQYVARDLSLGELAPLEKFNRLGSHDPWHGFYTGERVKFMPGFSLEDSIGDMN